MAWRNSADNTILFASSSGASTITMAEVLLFALYAFRVICCYSSGYIHPDEFFQSGQELFFPNSASSATVPSWEWESQHALRSVLPPTFMTWFPTKIYYMFRFYGRDDYGGTLHGFELLIAPRIFMCIASFAGIDAIMWMLVKSQVARKEGQQQQQHQHQRHIQKSDYSGNSSNSECKIACDVLQPVLLLLASSWTTLLFGTRPFTNTLESINLSLLLILVFGELKIRQSLIAFLVGCVCSIGVFTRITFVGFAAPVVVVFIYKCTLNDCESNLLFKKEHYHKQLCSKFDFHLWKNYALGCIYTTACIICGLLVTSIIFVNADVKFYHRKSLWDLLQLKSWYIVLNSITPLNFLRYNLNSENLAQHGLHPRYLHILVNMPLMFGPLALLHWIYMGRFLIQCLHSLRPRIEVDSAPVCKKSSVPNELTNNLYVLTLNAVVLSGLAMLSCAPHQEPRFLCPLIVPLILLHARSFALRKPLILLWIVFNLVLLIFFGHLHQSGVIPSMLFIGSQLSAVDTSARPDTIIYYKTYMPPSFLLHTSFRFKESMSWRDEEKSSGQMKRMDQDSSTCIDETFDESTDTSTQNQPKLLDSKSVDISSFCLLVRMHLPHCDNGGRSGVWPSPVYVVMPTVVAGQISCNQYLMADRNLHYHYSFRRVWGRKAHVGTEDVPQWINDNGFMEGVRSFIHDLDLAAYIVDCVPVES